MAAAAKQTQLLRLREKFPAEQVKQRPGGGNKMLDYVPIETVLERLLTEAPDYSWDGHVTFAPDGSAVVEGWLTIGEKKAYGVGAMKNSDTDMAVKSANSEAMKNAAKNGFGVALELWDADHRDALAAERLTSHVRLAAPDELTELKNRVADIAVAAGIDRTGPAIAAYFGVDVSALQDQAALEKIVATPAVGV